MDESNVTGLLHAWQGGDKDALERLLPEVYCQLKRLAAGHLRGERPNHTLQPTALVHEAYLRLIDQKRARWKSRLHFLAITSHLMRRVMVDHARRRAAGKREAQALAVPLDEVVEVAEAQDVDLVRLDDALEELAKRDVRQGRVIELRFFGGLTIDETAEVLGVSPATVKLDWTMARAWLFRQLQGPSC